jgi:ketosteroid isomerase-like protein
MKSRSQVLLLVLCTSLCLSSIALAKDKKGAAGGEDQVKAMLEQSRQAALKGDSSYLEQNASDDYTRVNADGTLLSKSDAVSALKNGDVKYQSIEPGDYKIRVYGDSAVAVYSADVKGTYKGQDMSGHNEITRVFVKRGGKWQEVAFHVSKAAS